jgi:hypothetical protein
MIWLLEVRRRGRPEMKWEREVERVIMQKNLAPEDTEKLHLWQKATEIQ